MSTADCWSEENGRYLEAALAALRLRLAGAPAAEVAAAQAGAAAAAQAASAAPALLDLAARLGLSDFERDILLLSAAMELDTRIPALCAQAQTDPGRPYPTFTLALTIFDDPAWEALAPDRPLRYWHLLEIPQVPGQPLTTGLLCADERIVNYLKGLNYLDGRLAPLLTPPGDPRLDLPLPPSQRAVVETALAAWHRSRPGTPLPLIQLTGPDAASKELVAARVAAAMDRDLCRMAVELLPTLPAELETLARLWERESLLLPLALYLDAQDGPAVDGAAGATARFLARSEGFFFLATRDAWARPGRPTEAIEVPKPTAVEQQAAWATALGPTATNLSTHLAGQFDLGVEAITSLAARVHDAPSVSPLADCIWHACVLHTRPQLDQLAQRLEPQANADDIILPEAEGALLREIINQVGHRTKVYEDWGFGRGLTRGRGISVLFAGPSGTGKTMAAEVIANSLQLDLFRIDLSAVVSKYIGETEKNLRRLFDAAEGGGAILFFDEADALFGKRSEVRDSHDRYANIEVNYLLQRMEAYRGLAILATNMKSAIDQAFLRRLRFVVNFPFPAAAQRELIWRKAFPPEAAVGDLVFSRLAWWSLTGGSIRNIALNAAFRAAQAETPITMPDVLAAARNEFRKLELPINEADFVWTPPVAKEVA